MQILYKTGDKIGNLIYLNEEAPEGKKGHEERRANFLCGCGKEFVTRIRNAKSMITKSCGCMKKEFMSKNLTKYPPVEYVTVGVKKIPVLNEKEQMRFWSKIALTANPNKCWDWQATGERYGGFKIGKATYKSSRVAYFLYYNQEPGELEVMHSCDNGKCCNPFHLSLGSHWDNMQDMVEKGRSITCGTLKVKV